MKFTETQDPFTLDIKVVIEIDRSRLIPLLLTDFDHALLAECAKSHKISDKLLALELLARKEEEQLGKKL